MKVYIQTIQHEHQRYDTVGDWRQDPATDCLQIRVSDLGNEIEEFLIAVHELVEAFACKVDGVSEESVDKFDMAYVGEEEPGDRLDAPYRRQHCLATGVERMLAAYFNIEWAEYEEHLDGLSKD